MKDHKEIKSAEEMQKEIDELKLKLDEMENNWKRALADYKNFEKRMNEEKYQIIARANEGMALRMLIILDNLEMVEKHSDDIGLKLTVKEFRQVFKDFGIEEVKVLGEDFDATKMEAIEQVDGGKNKVIEVSLKGYAMNGNLLRPAQVKVGKGE
jgi:molecular chaperone GrpE